MSLPVYSLDDRRFQDIVDEAKRLIPTYCPEWTNHNVSDPGVALIELFAWMTELTIFRLNQVPDAFYTHMLNLIGFNPFTATAARAPVTFWLAPGTRDTVRVPAQTQISTSGDVGEQRVFATIEPLVIAQPKLVAAMTSRTRPGVPEVVDDVSEQLTSPIDAITCFVEKPASSRNSLTPENPLTPGDCFYLGFENSLAGQAIQLSIVAKIKGTGVDPRRPPLEWEVSRDEAWTKATKYRDTTGGINQDGVIVILIPSEHQSKTVGERHGLFWLRARLLDAEPGQPTYNASPQILTLTAATIGGTVEAEHSERMPRIILGTSSGRPDQYFDVEMTPVLKRVAGEHVFVIEDHGKEVEWQEVDDFVNSTEKDRHVTWDSTTGRISFGPSIRYPDTDGRSRQHGMVPKEGWKVGVTAYRHGGGDAGNVGPYTLTALRSTLSSVDRVENLAPASGGVDAETIVNAKKRGPQTLRAGERAVTAEDYERLTLEADPAIARARCLPPTSEGQPIQLLVVPYVKSTEQTKLDAYALTADMYNRVDKYLEERRVLGTRISVGVPYYQGVSVAALVTAKPGWPVDSQRVAVRTRVEEALGKFINPIAGGSGDQEGSGWAFDEDITTAMIYQLLESIDGIERVDDVLLFEYDLRNGHRIGAGRETIKLERNSLFISAIHRVVVR